MSNICKSWLLLFAVTVLIGSLTGCVSIRDQMIEAGYNTQYIDGYVDGHASGQLAGGNIYSRFTKHTHRYQHDTQYQQGWEDGFRVGKGQYEAVGRSFY